MPQTRSPPDASPLARLRAAYRARTLRASDVLLLYVQRLRTHPVQEALAGVGVAIGVALVFAVQVSSTSVSQSARSITEGVSGAAQLRVASRDGSGFDAALVDAVRSLDGVEHAAPLLEQRAVVTGPNGNQLAVTFAGADLSLADLSGALAAGFPLGALADEGVMLPAAVTRLLGLPDRRSQTVLRPRPEVTLQVRGRAVEVPVTVLGEETIGPLGNARVAVSALPFAQRAGGLEGRVNRILVEAQPGAVDEVRRELEALTAGRLAVTTVDADARLLDQALRPNAQAAAFFGVVAALIGFLLAFNAMLLTAPERRRVIEELRRLRYRRSQIVHAFIAQALLLGAAASVIGLLIGAVLARTVLKAEPDYLASVFPIGMGTLVSLRAVVIAFCGGLLVTVLAAAAPLWSLRHRTPLAGGTAAGEGQRVTPGTSRRMLLAALVLLAMTNGLLLVSPTTIDVAAIGLVLAVVLLIPAAFAGVLRIAELVADRSGRLAALSTAVLELRSTSVRALALAAVGGVAVFGSLALEGARRDLLRGLYAGYADYVASADIWIVNPDDDLATKSMRLDGLADRVKGTPGVRDVRAYYGSFLDIEGRRAWVLGRSERDHNMVPASQVVDGDHTKTEQRMREGGWITLSEQLADDLDVGVADAVTVPTPSGPRRYRLAATTTNLGWTAGALIFNAEDYARAWAGAEPSALEVDVVDGSDSAAVARALDGAVGPGTGLLVQTAGERSEQANALAREGLRRLTEISLLLVIAAALAMAAAMGTSVWQRRSRLASMRLLGFGTRLLWRVLLIESALVLGTACIVGAASGLYGQWLIDQSLMHTTGFPAAFRLEAGPTAAIVGAVLALALLIVAVPGWRAAHAPKHLGLREPG